MSVLIDSPTNPAYKAVRVEKGDTLSQIALDYKSYSGGKTYKQLAAINNISNPDLLHIGQIIELMDSATLSKNTASNKPVINNFGVQSTNNDVLFATWKWNRKDTKEYKVEWSYNTGDNVWFIGSDSTTTYQQSTYNYPDEAIGVRVRVKAVTETKYANGQEAKSDSGWSTYEYYSPTAEDDEEEVGPPPTPTVKVDKYTLTAELNYADGEGYIAEFQVVRDSDSSYKSGKSTIKAGLASFTCTISPGETYRARCRTGNQYDEYTEWSDYSGSVSTIPEAADTPTVIRATSDTSVYLQWPATKGAKTYEIEYTTKKEYFDSSDATSTVSGIETTNYEKTGLESGKEYFFRVRAANEAGTSAWSGIVSVIIGKKPVPPTTWSSTTTVIVGEPLHLYWIHNAVDGSSQLYADLELTINGVTNPPITIKNSTDEDEKDKTSVYSIDTSDYQEGTKIQWRVRTMGITLEYSDWSVQRTVEVYAPPTLSLSFINSKSERIETLTSFPAYVSALAGPKTQAPIGYHVTVISNEAYETVDSVGRDKKVNIGEELYSKHFDIGDSLMIELSANNIDLENNINYTIICTVSMDSGLTVTESLVFDVAWEDISYEPNAEIAIDRDSIVAYIHPYCDHYESTFYEVSFDGSSYSATKEAVAIVWGQILYGVKTTTGEQVYSGILKDGTELFYYEVQNGVPMENVSLSVYRREFDGSFIEIATGLANTKNTYVTDPHPALDYARYRIIATSSTTGAVSYCDIRGYRVGETSIIIQWDEQWTDFDATSDDELAQPPWSGSLLKLPYNIDVSDNHKQDVELVEYIGRSHPVSYYGTHVGETATWNVEIPKNDKDTLYALRRLAKWMGDVYVREPSGSGYWANITVSFSQKHRVTTIPVTLNIIRVEGGM